MFEEVRFLRPSGSALLRLHVFPGSVAVTVVEALVGVLALRGFVLVQLQGHHPVVAMAQVLEVSKGYLSCFNLMFD